MADEMKCGPDGCDIMSGENTGQTLDVNDIPVIVTTKTCPHCKAVKELLNEKGIDYKEVYADEDPDFAASNGIMTAPTMILPDGKKLVGESEIRGYYA